MTKIRPSAVGSLILGLVAGVIAGIAIGRARPPAPAPAPASKAAPKDPGRLQSVLSSTEGREQLSDDHSALKERVVRQRAEIDTLTSRVAELERQLHCEIPALEKLAIAKEVYEALLGLAKAWEGGEGTGNYIKAIARLEELDASATPFFIEKYRTAQGVDAEVARALAICCGGREAVEFIKELIRNPSLGEKDRNSLLQCLSTRINDGICPAKPLPVDSELAQMAFRLADSSDWFECNAGLGLLERHDDPTSRAKLQQLASSHSDVGTRSRAILALGQVGDRTTLGFLQSYAISPDQPVLQRNLEKALDQLKKRFPE